MSIASVALELERISNSGLFPEHFPPALLISLSREIAAGRAGLQSPEDWTELRKVLKRYFRRLAGNFGEGAAMWFDKGGPQMIELIGELFEECICEEIVSRAISYDVRNQGMKERLARIILETVESELVSSDIRGTVN